VPDVLELEANLSLGERLNIVGKRFRCNFIKPGLVSYLDKGASGYELLRKETIDTYLNTMMGQPLVIEHVTTLLPVPENRIKGRVDNVGYDVKSGWYFCEGNVEAPADDVQYINTLEQASCGYRVPREPGNYGPGGTEHNIPFVREIKKLNFHHLAVTSDAPRYEDAIIRLNAKEEIPMFNWFFKKKVDGKDVEQRGTLPVDAAIQIDGQSVNVSELVADRQNSIKADAKAKEDAEKKRLADEAAKKTGDDNLNALDPQASIEVAPGVFVTVAELVADRQNAVKAKKEADEKAELERQNARAAGAESYRILAGARNQPVVPTTPIAQTCDSVGEQIARGKKMFGSN